jgi:hypothetical protein
MLNAPPVLVGILSAAAHLEPYSVNPNFVKRMLYHRIGQTTKLWRVPVI